MAHLISDQTSTLFTIPGCIFNLTKIFVSEKKKKKESVPTVKLIWLENLLCIKMRIKNGLRYFSICLKPDKMVFLAVSSTGFWNSFKLLWELSGNSTGECIGSLAQFLHRRQKKKVEWLELRRGRDPEQGTLGLATELKVQQL